MIGKHETIILQKDFEHGRRFRHPLRKDLLCQTASERTEELASCSTLCCLENGEEFSRVFEAGTKELTAANEQGHRYRYLAQGTLNPDVIESVAMGDNPAAVIKSHHNVGGLPEKMNFRTLNLVSDIAQYGKIRTVGCRFLTDPSHTIGGYSNLWIH